MFRFITAKPLWVSILVAVFFSIALVFSFFMSLGIITGHGEYDKVPSIVGKNFFAAKRELESKGFKVIVSDSVFTTEVPALNVTKQIPESEARVKHGRTIYLSVNRSVPPKIDMPSLIGLSYKYAGIYLQTVGLQMGDTTYKIDYARNTVLEQLFNGLPIKPGTKVPIGSKIDFLLGTGVADSTIDMPDLIGKNLKEARAKLDSIHVSVGSITIRGKGITDTAEAFVVDQNPRIFSEPLPGVRNYNKVKPGSFIDLYLGAEKPVKDSSNSYPPEYKRAMK